MEEELRDLVRRLAEELDYQSDHGNSHRKDEDRECFNDCNACYVERLLDEAKSFDHPKLEGEK